ncbi:MAG: phage head-tail connector protein [Ruminiclostridium sp.]|nr:phage head-tail connector protein [Ruminiclostridium sp.]
MTNIDIMRVLLPPDDNSSDIRLGILLDNAENTLLDYIGRESLPARLNDMVVQIALAMYNRLGTEGEIKRSENDVSYSFSDLITDDMKRRLKNYPRKVGAINADDTEGS